jgi:hypothetical protein
LRNLSFWPGEVYPNGEKGNEPERFCTNHPGYE